MKKINFTCPHCGGHRLIGEKPLQWIQVDVVGFDDDGDLLFDHDKPRIAYDALGDFEIYCDDCCTQFSLESLERELAAFKEENEELEEGNTNE